MEQMNKKEFIENATEILKDCGLTEKQADAIAHLTVILEKNKTSSKNCKCTLL